MRIKIFDHSPFADKYIYTHISLWIKSISRNYPGNAMPVGVLD